MLKKILSHTAIYGMAPQVSKVASFFALPIITQDLTPLDYGVSGVIMAYTTSITVFAALGLRLILVNSFFKHPNWYKWRWRQIYGFLTIWNIIFALIMAALIYFVIPDEALSNVVEIILLNVLPILVFGQTKTIGGTYYQINQRPLPIAWRVAISGLLTVGLNVYLISVLKMGYMGWFWSSFIVSILTNLSFAWPLYMKLQITPIFNFKRSFVRKALKVSLPTVPHYYSSYLLNSSDRMVMDLMNINVDSIGKYNLAYSFGKLIENLGMASGKAVTPLLNTYYKEMKEQKARTMVFMLQLLFLVITFSISLWVKEAFSFLIRNDELFQVYPLAIIIIMSYNYRPMYMGASAKLMYEEKTSLLWRISFIAGLSNVLLNMMLIPLFGFEVAAFTTFICLMYMGYSGFFLKVYRKISDVNYYPFLWISLTLILTIIAYIFVDSTIINKVIINLFILLISIPAYKKIKQYGV